MNNTWIDVEIDQSEGFAKEATRIKWEIIRRLGPAYSKWGAVPGAEELFLLCQEIETDWRRFLR